MRRKRKWMKKAAGMLAMGVLMFAGIPAVWAAGPEEARELIENICSTCHRFQGEPKTKFELKAPDLMWGGVKYQHDWLVRFLTGQEEMLYPNGYRWDLERRRTDHIRLNAGQAEAVARYFEEHFIDERVKPGAFNLDRLTEREAEFGAELYRQYSCLGCHQIKEDGKKIGGPISVTLYGAGRRYNLDWLYRFALNPQDFTPHSGEYLADLSPLKLRHLLGFLMAQGVEDYPFYRPWESEAFKQASVENGGRMYRQYCVQCHGPKGDGDGVGALGLTDPPPAKHSQMALSDLPIDYLYNVVYYGGKSVGKSPNMPDWGLTIHGQDFADLIAYLRATFKGGEQVAAASGKAGGPSGQCPQPRKTKKAPASFLNRKNPLPATPANIEAGKRLFMKDAKPVACMQCHGKRADGNGPLGGGLNPKPRNFTCGSMMEKIPDGQLFWIIKNGSPGTGMMPFPKLKDQQVWQLIHFIRSVAR